VPVNAAIAVKSPSLAWYLFESAVPPSEIEPAKEAFPEVESILAFVVPLLFFIVILPVLAIVSLS